MFLSRALFKTASYFTIQLVCHNMCTPSFLVMNDAFVSTKVQTFPAPLNPI